MLVKFGKYVHIGKWASLGFGEYEVFTHTDPKIPEEHAKKGNN
jgi:hypothetical protein